MPRRAPALPFFRRLAGLSTSFAAALAASTWSLGVAFAQTSPLPALGLDPTGVSVSGLSSGGYMAAQFEVAHAASLRGAAIVAAGPYGCAMGSVSTAALTCSCPYETTEGSGPVGLPTAVARLSCITLPASLLSSRAMTAAEGNRGHIDPIGALRKHRVWLYSGDADPVVDPAIVDGLQAFYAAVKVPARQVRRVKGPKAGHGMPVAGQHACELTKPPYINGCDIDGAGELLKWVYAQPSSLQPGQAQAAALRPFDQTPYREAGVFDGLDSTGWVYVPQRCEQAGVRCKLHVVFHGCEQGQNFPARGQPGAPVYGTVFVDQAGYNRWAESMGLVVLYPQVLPSNEGSVISPFRFNPKGCWDFWGYTSPLGDASLSSTRPPYARKEAPQMRAVQAMIDALLRQP